jgi:hypothetical protein
LSSGNGSGSAGTVEYGMGIMGLQQCQLFRWQGVWGGADVNPIEHFCDSAQVMKVAMHQKLEVEPSTPKTCLNGMVTAFLCNDSYSFQCHNFYLNI